MIYSLNIIARRNKIGIPLLCALLKNEMPNEKEPKRF